MKFLTRSVLAIAVAAWTVLPLRAQEVFPSKPVRIVVPFTAGGPTDVLARMLGERLSEKWKQPVVIENRAGGGSTIGTNLVAKAPADGHTIGMVVMAHVVNPAIRSDLPYDTLGDLAGVSQITTSACVLVAHPSVPANNVRELIPQLRTGKVTRGVIGGRVGQERFEKLYGKRLFRAGVEGILARDDVACIEGRCDSGSACLRKLHGACGGVAPGGLQLRGVALGAGLGGVAVDQLQKGGFALLRAGFNDPAFSEPDFDAFDH